MTSLVRMTLRRLGIYIRQILVESQPTRCLISARGSSLSPLLICLSSVQVLQLYIYIGKRRQLAVCNLYGVFYSSCLFGVRLRAYLVVRNASSPRDGGKEASSCIALDRSIRVRLNRSTLLFYSLVYSARYLKVMPLSAHYICKVSPVYLKACSLSLQKKIISQQNCILISQ